MHKKHTDFSKYLPGVAAVAMLMLIAAGIATYAPKGSRLAPATAQASGTAITGWAWSSNIGWISFSGTAANSTAYGVTMGSNGALSGYAWGDNIGWINFGANSCGATPTLSGGALTGFAQAINTGSDGCISLNGTASNGTAYGVSLSGTTLTGYAWASDTIGWLSFSGTASNGNPYNVIYGGAGAPSCTLSVAPNPSGTGSPITLNYTTTNSPATGTITQGSSAAPIVKYLTSGSTWVVPSDWNNSNNTIEVIGGGGGGTRGPGGGGGAYSKISNLSLTPGATVNIAIGTGGTGVGGGTPGSGGDTWFGSTATVLAKGGGISSDLSTTGGAGGAAASGVGSTKYSGGNAAGASGAPTSPWFSGGGGGGAAGSHGNGNNGSVGVQGGGGGAGGSGDTSLGGAGGAGGPTQGVNGTAGTSGTEYDASHGSGGGGGGGASYQGPGVAGGGGKGGTYGAGGGGGGQNGGTGLDGTGGTGGTGIIIITYYSSSNVITNSATNSSSGVSATAPSSAGSYTYNMTVTSPSGSGSCSATLTVQTDICNDLSGIQTSEPATCTGTPPTCVQSGYIPSGSGSTASCIVSNPTISPLIAPTRVRAGSMATIQYTVTNPPASCSITGITSTTTSFSATVSPTSGVQDSVSAQVYANTLFTMTCGSVSRQITVGIDPTIIEQ
jgi:hypothetical protein